MCITIQYKHNLHDTNIMYIKGYLLVAVSVYVAAVAYTYITMPISSHLALTYWKLSSQPTLMDRLKGLLSSLFAITPTDSNAVQLWTKSSQIPTGVFGTVFKIATSPFQFISQSSLAGWIYRYTHNASVSFSANTNVGFVQTYRTNSILERIATFFSSQNFTFFIPTANVTSTQLSIHIPHWSQQLAKGVGISVGIYAVSYVLSHTLHAVSLLF